MAPKAPVVAPNAEGAEVAVGAPNEKDDGFAAAPNVDPNAEGAAAAGAPNPIKIINIISKLFSSILNGGNDSCKFKSRCRKLIKTN